jgi:hypothetical protein
MSGHLLVVLCALVVSGCAKPHVVTEAELLGTWLNVAPQPARPPVFASNQVFIDRHGAELLFYSDKGLAFIHLLPGGDSLRMSQGCFSYDHAVSFKKAQPGSRDTLFVESFGKYTRRDTASFFATWRARTAALKEQQREFDRQRRLTGD